jgi:hypothetical protein
MSKDKAENVVHIEIFKYPLAIRQRQNQNEHMAQLNYMTSRVRAVICEWLKEKVAIPEEDQEGLDLWWWTGLQKEMVMYKT